MTESTVFGIDEDDAQDLILLADSLRQKLRERRLQSIQSRDAYRVVETPRRHPSRVKLSLSRPLSDSEKVFFHNSLNRTSYRDRSGAITSMFEKWEPHSGTFLCDFRKFRVRLSRNEQIYAESNVMGSVRLSDAVRSMLEDYFLNLHPVAAKTLRELE